MTTALAVPTLPAESVAVKTTVVSPNGNVVGASLAKTVDASVSTKAAVVRNPASLVSVAATPAPLAATTEMSSGDVTTGTASSLTLTVADAVPMFPELSVTEKVTTVSPSEKVAGASFVSTA